MEEIKNVRKRDGRIVPFDKEKITEAIFKAAKSVGGENRYLAEDITEAVTLYLNKKFQGQTPSVEEIQDAVERVLIKTGHAKTAKAYILYRQRRANVRKVREGIKPPDLIEREEIRNIRDIKISVVRSDENLTDWNREKIIEALLRETGISRNIAEIIVSEVEEEVITSKLNVLTSSIIRELVNSKLVKYGFEKEREKHSRIGIPLYDVEQIFKNFKGTPDQLSLKFGQHIKKEYAISNVFSDEVIFSHFKKEIFIHCLEEIDKFYSLEVNWRDEEENLKRAMDWCSFVFFKSDKLLNWQGSNNNILRAVEIPLLGGFDFLAEIVKERPFEVELNKERQGDILYVGKISLNTPSIKGKDKIFSIIKKAFDEKRKFLENILSDEIKEFFDSFKKKNYLEISTEDINIENFIFPDEDIKIGLKTSSENFVNYLKRIESKNFAIKGKISQNNISILHDIKEDIFVKVNLW
ncbi:MAG TPA: ATP cone domain-containing protein [Candidatus Ratteibacteria bacterium]|nr:ATP cone domain-containing protein [Candidatus Ratteibacteria bacterium]